MIISKNGKAILMAILAAALFGIMIAGAYLAASDKHKHRHIHTDSFHEHRHSHDEGHHNHQHEDKSIKEHSHSPKEEDL